jgi:hypothetical protein
MSSGALLQCVCSAPDDFSMEVLGIRDSHKKYERPSLEVVTRAFAEDAS